MRRKNGKETIGVVYNDASGIHIYVLYIQYIYVSHTRRNISDEEKKRE